MINVYLYIVCIYMNVCMVICYILFFILSIDWFVVIDYVMEFS